MMSSTFAFKAAFFDIDSMGVMWHGNYVKYMEMARCQLLDEIGYNYIDMKNDGFAMPIVKMELKYIAPIMFNEDFNIQITLIECDTLLKLSYVFLQNQKPLAKATTSQACVNMNTLETQFCVPQGLLNAFKSYAKGEKK